MELMRQVTKEKFKHYLERKKVGDTISSYLNFLDIINILSIEENTEVKKEKIINCWKYLYGYSLKNALTKTLQDLSIRNMQDSKSEDFNKKFKINYHNESRRVKEILEYIFTDYQKVLQDYFNKEPIETKKQAKASKDMLGGIAYEEY